MREGSKFIFLRVDILLSQGKDYPFPNELPGIYTNCLWEIYKWKGLFLDSQVCSIDLYICPYASTTLSWLFKLKLPSFEVGKCNVPNNFVHLQIVLSILSYFSFQLLFGRIAKHFLAGSFAFSYPFVAGFYCYCIAIRCCLFSTIWNLLFF